MQYKTVKVYNRNLVEILVETEHSVLVKMLSGSQKGENIEVGFAELEDVESLIVIDCLENNTQFDMRTRQIDVVKLAISNDPNRYKIVSISLPGNRAIDIPSSELV